MIQAFAAACDALGLTNADDIVVYDRSGIFSAPRVWWTFQVMGHSRVAVLDGGWPAWCAAGYAVDASPVDADAVHAPARAAAAPDAAPRFQATLQVRVHAADPMSML